MFATHHHHNLYVVVKSYFNLNQILILIKSYFKRRNDNLMNGKSLSENFTYIKLDIHRPGFHGNIIAVCEIIYCKKYSV